MLVKDLGLENGNSVQIPATHDARGARAVESSSAQQLLVTVCTMFVNERQADEACQVSETRETVRSNIRIREIGRRGDNIHRLGLGRLQGARMSSSAGVIMLSDHALKAYTRKRKIIGMSSSEAALYAAALGASASKGIVPFSKDFGYEKKLVLAVDAKATEHILHRQGIGKLKHIDVACLWMQDEIRPQRLRVRRDKSEENVADSGSHSAKQ